MPEDFPCTHPGCHRTFKRPSNRTQHYNTHHRLLSPDSEPDAAHEFHIKYHPKLNALPCDKDGNFLPAHTRPPPLDAPNATKDNMYHPFEDQLAFNWACYHFAELQSSEREINKGLNLWLAPSLKAGDDTPLPWSSAEEMYQTIDAIQEGDAPFDTICFKYAGPICPNPPAWMTETYELSDFASTFTPRPYRQFDHTGDCVWSNLMSGDWVWNEADTITQDKRTHGAMLVPIISGSDKTMVSVATGHQEYHPVYESPGIITNTARRTHGNAVLPVTFLPIPKTNKQMTVPEVVRCPDGHFRRAIYSLGPYIADYPEQVWLAGIVQGWCPKCEAKPDNLYDNLNETRRRKHERTDFIIKCFDPGTVWENYGIRSDVVPFTHGFPRADIHTLLSPDLLHQLIKGTFKDHLVTWVNDYLHIKYGEARALEIIHDIDRRISAVPSYAGLRRFSKDDSKALMKVYIAAIAGHVPSTMVQCISTFMDLCYIFWQNAITAKGVHKSISLPRQHALPHYLTSITLCGSPNGLCLSITESKHIKAVKEPWCQLLREGLLRGSTAAHFASNQGEESELNGDEPAGSDRGGGSDDDEDANQEKQGVEGRLDDAGPENGPPSLSSITLAATPVRRYPKDLHKLAQYINEPNLPSAFKSFLYSIQHPNRPVPDDVETRVNFSGKIYIFHSAITRFYAPSDLCGPCGMYRQRIRCNPSWYGHPQHDTAFVVEDENQPGMQGMHIAQIRLLFLFTDYETNEVLEVSTGKQIQCALVSWFVPASEQRDPDTGMWTVKPEGTRRHQPVQVIPLKSIARGAHLLPKYGVGMLPDYVTHVNALDTFQTYFVNPYIDHHCHEFLSD
ncbi:hypothetical protein BYT27DRAFT_7221263 [Phlegmacium glaucopus]|nr:hypothetical protein BYT27DRAFT_7221263 [Phlegmacium glaucopus]